MKEKVNLSTFHLDLDRLIQGEVIADETPELAFARRLRKADLSPRSRIQTILRAELLPPESSSEFPQVPLNSSKPVRTPFKHLSSLKPTLAFGAVMILLVLFLAWALTNTTPQPAIPEETTKGFSLLILDYQGMICCGEGRAEWLDAETLQTSKELNIPFARGIVAAPDGDVIFDQGNGDLISLDLVAGEQTKLVTASDILVPMGNYPVPFAISPDGTRLVTAHYDFTGEGDAADITRFWRSVFDLTTNTLLYKFPPEPEHVREAETPACLMPVMMISPDASRLYELCVWGGSYPLNTTPTVRAIDLDSSEILRTLSVPLAWDAILSHNGSLMYVFTSVGEILVLNTQNLETLKTYQSESLVTEYGGGRRTAISQDGMTLFMSTYALTGKHQFFAIDAQSGEIITQIEGDGSIDNIVVASDNQTVFTLALLEGGRAVVTAHDPVTLEAKYHRAFEGELIPKRLIGVPTDFVLAEVISPTPLPTIPAPRLLGDLFFLIRSTSPPFYYQWGHMPAFCGGDRMDCVLQMLPALPGGEAIPDAVLSWSPDGTRAIFFNANSQTPKIFELNAVTGEWREMLVDFWVMQEKYFWTPDGQWIVFQAQGEGAYTSYVGMYNPTTGDFWNFNETPGEERDPLGWLNENELLVQLIRPNLDGQQTLPDVRYVRLDVQTGQETEYTETMGPGPRPWDGGTFLSPDGQWYAIAYLDGASQTEIVLMRPDGSQSNSVFKGSGLYNSVNWLNDEYLFVQLYNEQIERNILYLISLADNTVQEISIPGLDTSAFDISQVSFRPNADPPFSGTSAGPFPSPTLFPTHEATIGDPLTVLQTITAQHTQNILSGSGWLHIQSRHYYTSEESDPLPNGDPIPNPFIFDNWYQLDEQRQIVRAVNLFTDENGHINQVSIQRDGQSINLTLGEQSPADPFNPNFDLDFAENTANLVAVGQTLRMSDFYVDGQYGGVVFNIQIDSSLEWEALFDPDTGQLRNLTLYQLVSSGRTLQRSTSILIEEWVDEPPADILAYLDQELLPYAPLPPIGTPAPAGFDASHSDLTFKIIFGDDITNPSFIYMDVYAEGYLLGRFDSGGIPGGLCDRSWNGGLIALNYLEGDLATLRWFSLKDVTMFRDLPGYNLHSPATFAPNDFRVAFVGCKEDDCGIFVKDLEFDGAVIKLSDGETATAPGWSPDGEYVIIWYGGFINERGITNIKVVHAETGEVLYMGDPTLDDSPLQAWDMSVMYKPFTSTQRCEAPPDTISSGPILPSPDSTYTVQEGDTLVSIANQFGLAMDVLLSLNGLSPDMTLVVGQVLIVAPPISNP